MALQSEVKKAMKTPKQRPNAIEKHSNPRGSLYGVKGTKGVDTVPSHASMASFKTWFADFCELVPAEGLNSQQWNLLKNKIDKL
jgi:hypothetical protein